MKSLAAVVALGALALTGCVAVPAYPPGPVAYAPAVNEYPYVPPYAPYAYAPAPPVYVMPAPVPWFGFGFNYYGGPRGYGYAPGYGYGYRPGYAYRPYGYRGYRR
jgi:hypothetical protein